MIIGKGKQSPPIRHVDESEAFNEFSPMVFNGYTRFLMGIPGIKGFLLPFYSELIEKKFSFLHERLEERRGKGKY